MGVINDVHAALAKFLQHAVVGKRLAYQTSSRITRFTRGASTWRERLGCHFQRRRLDEASGVLVVGKQGLHLTAEVLVPRTGLLEESNSPAFLDLQRRVEQLLDLPPAFRSHLASSRSARAGPMPWASFHSDMDALGGNFNPAAL
jgi:hypothetical protein